jgi:hypothetical protein
VFLMSEVPLGQVGAWRAAPPTCTGHGSKATPKAAVCPPGVPHSYENTPPPLDHHRAPLKVLGGAFSHERGTPVVERQHVDSAVEHRSGSAGSAKTVLLGLLVHKKPPTPS